MRTVTTRTGATLPVLGQGTWRMGEAASRRKDEVAALRLGFELGMTLVDTAEMYANGGAERVVGEAIADCRERIFVVSKVLPENASRQGTVTACERSLKRLGTDYIDLYLLHWQSDHPFQETLEAFEQLRVQGKIRHFGVSNIDIEALRQLETLPLGRLVTADQVIYNLQRRGIERNVLPFAAQAGMAIMAYSPLDQTRLAIKEALSRVAARHETKAEVIALAWTLRHPHVVAIPKSSNPRHVQENAKAARIRFTEQDLAELEEAYPPPKRTIPLETA
ncbi:MAG: aldo/keto reductase [Planctomycetaceae bacterium]|nr:putative oxidoreductase [Planctomycetota bacterium]MCQ3949931.1 aldo/keto reductase [Planctomycetota bacterium]NUO16987.1 aldo/keto reductase [Planctomycetaceae bacterium]HRJ78959.1 aldo/keto reductase [Planctomycetota bacterium]